MDESIPRFKTSVDDVIIPSGSVITLDQSDSVRSIDLQSGGFIFVNNAFTVSGASSTNSTIAGDMTVSATLTFSASNVSVTGDISVGAGKQIVFSDTNSQISNTGEITLNSDSSNFSSLIYGGTNYSGAGTFEYNRFISGTSTAWELIGSPVSGQTASDMIGQTNLANNGSDFGIGTYNNAGTGNSGNGTWSTFSNVDAAVEGEMDSGKGFQMATDNGSTVTFDGSLVTSVVDVAISEGDESGEASTADGTRFNLIANPYPTYLSVNSGAAYNESTYDIGDLSSSFDNTGKSINYFANFSFNMRIFDGGKLYKNLKSLKIQKDINELQLNKIKNEVIHQLSLTNNKYNSLVKNYNLNE